MPKLWDCSTCYGSPCQCSKIDWKKEEAAKIIYGNNRPYYSSKIVDCNYCYAKPCRCSQINWDEEKRRAAMKK